MKEEAWEIVITTEAPRIGSGYRLVRAKHGRKWTYITTLWGDGRTKLSKSEWNKIKKRQKLCMKEVNKGLRRANKKLWPRSWRGK
tara:strand:+ start:570 stop:824 length:255 start_codon:yes stop_codon:yes gene_type:complete